MFAADCNIIKHFQTMVSVDQGYMVQPKLEAALRIVENAMEARVNPDACFHWATNTELGLLNGAQINLGLPVEDFHILQTYDLNAYSFSREGAEEVIDYLADMYKEYFWYAQSVLASQTKKRNRGRVMR